METFTRTWVLYSDQPEAHIAAWKAAAGLAGAHFPQEFRPLAGLDQASILLAAAEATRAIWDRCPLHLPAPRGCVALFERGKVILRWLTENHRIDLEASRVVVKSAGRCIIEATCKAEEAVTRDAEAYAEAREEGGSEPERSKLLSHFERLVVAEKAAREIDPEATFEFLGRQ